jgi:hypothetical protein
MGSTRGASAEGLQLLNIVAMLIVLVATVALPNRCWPWSLPGLSSAATAPLAPARANRLHRARPAQTGLRYA